MTKHAFAVTFDATRIDAKLGVIYGVSVMTVGPARGHGVICDQTTLEQVRDCSAKYSGGLKVKMTHAGDAGDIVGALKAFRIEGKQLRADLHLLTTYEKREYVLELAEKMPDTFGLSVSFSGPQEEKGGLMLARCLEIYSCDLVAEPAANVNGLFAAVDAAGKGVTPMTPEQISTQIKEAVATALSEFTTKLAALETALKSKQEATEFAALKTELSTVKTALETAKTDLAAKIGDDTTRLQLAAKAVAIEFTRHTGQQGLPADGGGKGGDKQPTAVEKFDATLTKHFDATKSKTRAWQLAMTDDPAGYSAFINAKAKPSFEKAKAA